MFVASRQQQRVETSLVVSCFAILAIVSDGMAAMWAVRLIVVNAALRDCVLLGWVIPVCVAKRGLLVAFELIAETMYSKKQLFVLTAVFVLVSESTSAPDVPSVGVAVGTMCKHRTTISLLRHGCF